jgi:hypothetical protein
MGTISQTYSFVAGSIPTAANWNSNWTTVLGLVNGALDSANVDKTSSDAIMVVDTAQTLTAAKTFNDNVKALFGTGSDAEIYYDATNLVIKPNAVGSGVVQVNGGITVGVNDTGHDVQMFGAAAGAYLLWDESANTLDIRGATAAGPGAISLETAELTVVDGDILGRIDFSAPAESDGTDAILVGASIWAEADDTFAADNNATSLVFAAATSETAAAVMRLSKTALTPQTTDGLSLGTSALNFSDLFLDSGAVINFDSDNVTVTHSSNTLTVAGAVGISGDLTLSAGGDGALNFSNAGENSIKIPDNQASALIIEEANNAYMTFITTNSSEAVSFSKNVGVGTTAPNSTSGRTWLTIDNSTAGGALESAINGNAAWQLSTDADYGLYLAIDPQTNGTNSYFGLGIDGSTKMWLDKNGALYVGDTENADVTVGLTINQGANDNAIIALKSSDITHGLTGQAETDTFLNIQKGNATVGGVTYQAIAEDGATSIVVTHDTWGGTADTTKADDSNGLMTYNFREHNGSNAVADMATNSNLVAIKGYIGGGLKTRFIWDVEGSAHAEVEWTTYDAEDDFQLIQDVEAVLVPEIFGEAVQYKEDDLVRLGLFGKGSIHQEPNGKMRGMMNQTKMVMLHHGTLNRMVDAIRDLTDRLTLAEQKLLA